MNKKSLIVALPMMLAIALSGCTPAPKAPDTGTPTPSVSQTVEATPSASTSTTSAPATTAAPQPTTNSVAQSSVTDSLNALVVSAESASDTYERDNFNHWVSKNSTNCDTRYAVLLEESLSKPVTTGCTVVSGEWKSAYDAQTITDPKKLDIDHMVPLKEAWESGASKWEANARESYANDMTYADALVAVTAASNRSKSDRDPAGWLPTDVSNRCSYVAKWVAVKTKWKLTIDAQEKDAIQSVLNNCGADTTNPKVEPAPVTENPVAAAPTAKAPVAAPPVAGTDGNDPKYTSCSAALAGGFGPYTKGEPEYDWYRDGDGDGIVCEK